MALYSSLQQGAALTIAAVQLKDTLCQIDGQDRNLAHGPVLLVRMKANTFILALCLARPQRGGRVHTISTANGEVRHCRRGNDVGVPPLERGGIKCAGRTSGPVPPLISPRAPQIEARILPKPQSRSAPRNR